MTCADWLRLSAQLYFVITAQLAAIGLWRALAAGRDRDLRNDRLRHWLLVAVAWPVLIVRWMVHL